MSLKELLINSKARLGVWGCGYIGFTTMINFAQEGIYSIGCDVSPNVVQEIKEGKTHIPNLDFWIGYHIGDLVRNMIAATDNWKDMMADDIKVHLIAVPTERGGEPWFEPLQDVIDKLALRKKSDVPDLVIIESTLTPGMFDKVVVATFESFGIKVGKDVLVGIAPRRDWFDSPEKNLKALNRVIGGTTPETTQIMKEVLGIVCDKLIPSDAHTTELVKSVENSIFHVCAVYASQLACAYPNVNIREVLKLASTHWRIPLYFPSVGTGGYCIPVSSKYVLNGAEVPEVLSITKDTLKFDQEQPTRVADMIVERTNGGAIGVLGLSYKRDLKVHVLSASLRIINELKERGVVVKAFDPYYSEAETLQVAGVESFACPDELGQFKGLIVVPPHRVFSQIPKNMLLDNINNGTIILDNEGVWQKWRDDFKFKGIKYYCIGDKGWYSHGMETYTEKEKSKPINTRRNTSGR